MALNIDHYFASLSAGTTTTIANPQQQSPKTPPSTATSSTAELFAMDDIFKPSSATATTTRPIVLSSSPPYEAGGGGSNSNNYNNGLAVGSPPTANFSSPPYVPIYRPPAVIGLVTSPPSSPGNTNNNRSTQPQQQQQQPQQQQARVAQANLLLARALASGDLRAAQDVLRDDGADPNGRVGDDQQTMLMYACTAAPSDESAGALASLLLRSGASTSALCAMGRTVLHRAAGLGSSSTTTLSTTTPNDSSASTATSTQQPVMRRGSMITVKVLLEEGGIPVDVSDMKGMTPLHHASAAGNYSVAELLLRRGANANAKDRESATPLHMAAKNDHPELILLLLKWGADAASKHGRCSTPLHFAAGFGSVNSISALINSKDVHVDVLGGGKQTPLHFAVHNRHLSCAKLLIQRGANPNAVSVWGTPLQMAINNGDLEMEKFLRSCHLTVDPSAPQPLPPSPPPPQTQATATVVTTAVPRVSYAADPLVTLPMPINTAAAAATATGGSSAPIVMVNNYPLTLGNATIALPVVVQMFPHLQNKQVYFNGSDCGAVLTTEGIKHADGTVYTTPTSFTRRLSGSRSSGWKQLSVVVEKKHVPLWFYKNYYLQHITSAKTTVNITPVTPVQPQSLPCFLQSIEEGGGGDREGEGGAIEVFGNERMMPNEVCGEKMTVMKQPTLKVASRVSKMDPRDVEMGPRIHHVSGVGSIYEARLLSSSTAVIVCKLKSEGVMDEILNARTLAHPTLLSLLGWFVDPVKKTHPMLVAESVVGCLSAWLATHKSGGGGGYSVLNVMRFVQSIARAMKLVYTPDEGGVSNTTTTAAVCLTAETILLTADGRPRVCTLPCLNRLLGKQQQQQNEGENEEKQAVHSLGMTMSQLLHTHSPSTNYVSGQLLALMKMCVNKHAVMRPGFAQIVDALESLQPHITNTIPFWSALDKLDFITVAAEYCQTNRNEYVNELEMESRVFLFGLDWKLCLDAPLQSLVKLQHFNSTTVQGLLSFIQFIQLTNSSTATTTAGLSADVLVSFLEVDPSDSSSIVLSSDAIVSYFELRFPSLIEHLFKVLSKDTTAISLQSTLRNISSHYIK